MSQLKGSKELELPYLWEDQPFCSMQAFKRSDGVHPHWQGPFALLNLPIQIVLASRNSFTLTTAPS